jgi:hypothetical protein
MLKLGLEINLSHKTEAFLSCLIREVIEALKPQQQATEPTLTHEVPIMARYKFNADQEPVTFPLVFKGGLDKKGNPVGAGDVDLSIESGSASIVAELGQQTLRDDGNEVKADVTLSGGPMAVADLAVVTYKAKNRDTGNVVAADSDEFETGPGEVAIGTLDSPVPLPEVV